MVCDPPCAGVTPCAAHVPMDSNFRSLSNLKKLVEVDMSLARVSPAVCWKHYMRDVKEAAPARVAENVAARRVCLLCSKTVWVSFNRESTRSAPRSRAGMLFQAAMITVSDIALVEEGINKSQRVRFVCLARLCLNGVQMVDDMARPGRKRKSTEPTRSLTDEDITSRMPRHVQAWCTCSGRRCRLWRPPIVAFGHRVPVPF